jgi:hypothetical protein
VGSVTPTLVADQGYVRVEVNWTDFAHNRRVWIYRTVGGVDTKLRDGDYAWLSGGLAVAYDHEAPLDVPITYKSAIPLNWNGDMEAGVLEWQDTTNNGTVGTVTQNTDFYVAGTGAASAQLAPTGAAAISKAVSEFIPATVGTSYTFNARLMLLSYWTAGIGVQIQWYNGTTLLSTSGTLADVTPFPGVWGSYSVTATAPATTTQMKLVAGIQGTPPATQLLLVDEAYATTAAATVTSSTVVVPSAGGGWWTDPLHPATKVRLVIDLPASACAGTSGVAYLGVGDVSRPADSQAMEINDAEYPVAAFQRRKSGRQATAVGVSTLADRDRVVALHATGAPLLLQINGQYGEADTYQLHGDTAERRINGDQTVAWRIMSSEFVRVLPPVGPAEGTLRARYADLTKYATFAAATSAGATWLDVVRGNAAA